MTVTRNQTRVVAVMDDDHLGMIPSGYTDFTRPRNLWRTLDGVRIWHGSFANFLRKSNVENPSECDYCARQSTVLLSNAQADPMNNPETSVSQHSSLPTNHVHSSTRKMDFQR